MKPIIAIKHTENSSQEAVRVALITALPRRPVVLDLGPGFSTLGKWVLQYRSSDLTAQPQAYLAGQNERLRLENGIHKRFDSSCVAKHRDPVTSLDTKFLKFLNPHLLFPGLCLQ